MPTFPADLIPASQALAAEFAEQKKADHIAALLDAGWDMDAAVEAGCRKEAELLALFAEFPPDPRGR